MCTKGCQALFWYKTVKVVEIRNWKLGLLHFSIQALVVIYVVLYVLFIQKGYNGSSPIQGYTYTKLKGSSPQLQPDGSYVVWDATDIGKSL
jgi:hypothetical protein